MVRLGTCIALELAVAGGAITGVWFIASRASDVAGSYLHGREAEAATATYAPSLTVAPLERSRLAIAPRGHSNVFGAPDGELLAPIGATPVTKVKLNHGGTSLSLR